MDKVRKKNSTRSFVGEIIFLLSTVTPVPCIRNKGGGNVLSLGQEGPDSKTFRHFIKNVWAGVSFFWRNIPLLSVLTGHEGTSP